MRRNFKKIAMIAHAGISFIFVLLTVLILSNILPLNFQDGAVVVDSVVLVLIIVLALFYVGLTAYLLYCTFNQTQLLKYVELYSDSTTSVMATSKTIKRMVTDNAKQLGTVKVNKIRISSDGKYGLILTVLVHVKSDEVSLELDTLRCMCQDTFFKVLGLRFSSINFKIEKINGHYKADTAEAKQQAKTMDAERKYARDCYEDPTGDKCDEDNQPSQDVEDDESTQQSSDEQDQQATQQ
ncbi:MAG: hypothetical protein IKC47_04100 [Clostridia bacterium]|nr:hypothetical protein [Clostridia bacterium]